MKESNKVWVGVGAVLLLGMFFTAYNGRLFNPIWASLLLEWALVMVVAALTAFSVDKVVGVL